MKRIKKPFSVVACVLFFFLIIAPAQGILPGFSSPILVSKNSSSVAPHGDSFSLCDGASRPGNDVPWTVCHVAQGSNTIKLLVSYQPPELRVTGNSITLFFGEEARYTTREGYPQLPYVPQVFTFPLGTRITDIRTSSPEITTISLSGQLKPAPALLPIPEISSRDRNQYRSETPEGSIPIYTETYPSEWATYSVGGGLTGGEHVTFLVLQLFPCRYNPIQNSLSYVQEMEIQITYDIPVKLLVQNETYDFLIITPPEFQDELQPLIHHKALYGVTTKLVTTQGIYDGAYFTSQGRDSPEKIKYFLKNAIEAWGITNALLVGDIDHVPSREVYSFWWEDSTMYSDHYYADIYDGAMEYCSWDSNNNNRFGELDPESDSSNDDYVDLYADIYLGRLACHDTTEVATVVNKIITYETTTSGKEWFTNLILMGGDTFPSWNDILEGEVVNEYVASVMPDFTPIKIQISQGNFLPHRINQILSEGAGFVCFSGHGFEYGFGTYPHDSNWMIAYYTPYLLWLKNNEKLPIVFFDACLTAKLDYHMLSNPDIPCFAWALVKKPDGGAIATIGATETATTSVDENGPQGQAGYLDLHFFMAYQPGISVAEMLVQAQNDYLRDVARGYADDRVYVMTIEQFLLLGDPTLIPGGYP